MEKRSRFRNYISVQAITMIGILGVRYFVSLPQVVTIVTFLLFLMTTLGILYWEIRQEDFRRYLTFYAGLAFVLIGILPVMILRIVEWSAPLSWSECFQ